ncbi:hypothetical protein EGK75_09200 [Neisseria weixii]|uniref:Uncharacterized protein n=1 Tax=Neisseria weixii TaxID=1853276 RepID=A0A3N4NQ65_9NEIS|nr:hypothetical protein [Neisseria weixii]RPD86287.1 hypothetical protein EGK75_09200 [Neisseria weixii]RPD89393.1 hypothetical protein EGK74_04015 [Neisseria weixii]
MNAQQINDIMAASNIAGYAKEWNNRRIYINLNTCDRSFAGNRSYQLYFDISAGKLVSKIGKGTTSRAFDADVKKIESLFA